MTPIIAAPMSPKAAGPEISSLRWCDPASAAPRDVSGDVSDNMSGGAEVIFNEIAWMGSAQDPNHEWIELRNTSDDEVAIGDWQIMDRSGKIRINFDGTDILAKDSFLVLERGKDYSGALSNTGARLILFDDECHAVDEVDATVGWPAGSNTTKRTLERDADGKNWHSSEEAGGSRGKINSVPDIPSEEIDDPEQSADEDDDEASDEENEDAESDTNSSTATSTPTSTSTSTATTTSTATSTPPAPASTVDHLVIAAVRITGGTGATDEDLVKIYNPTSGNIDLSGWKLRKRTRSGTESSMRVFADGSMISSGGHFIWANSANGFSLAAGANASSTQTLSADNSIALLTADDAIVDAAAWGSEHVNPFIEGSAYPASPEEGQMLVRKAQGGEVQDTGNNSGDFSLEPDTHVIQ